MEEDIQKTRGEKVRSVIGAISLHCVLMNRIIIFGREAVRRRRVVVAALPGDRRPV